MSDLENPCCHDTVGEIREQFSYVYINTILYVTLAKLSSWNGNKVVNCLSKEREQEIEMRVREKT